MRNWILGVVGLILAALPAAAQDERWLLQLDEDDAYVYGLTQFGDLPFYLYCLAPSGAGKDPAEVGAEEFRPLAPYHWRIEVDQLIAPRGEGEVRDDLALVLDGTRFELPGAVFNSDAGTWAVDLAMGGPVLAALLDVEDLVFAIGAAPNWGMAVTDLQVSLSSAMGSCADGWEASGVARPADLPSFAQGE